MKNQKLYVMILTMIFDRLMIGNILGFTDKSNSSSETATRLKNIALISSNRVWITVTYL